jgi:hypothetical protein
MNQRARVSDDRPRAGTTATASRLRVALLLGAAGVVSTAALLAAIEPKLPPFVGD